MENESSRSNLLRYGLCFVAADGTNLSIPCNTLLGPFRKAVSRNRRRYQKDGFDLDLTHISKQVIVHGFPASGIEFLYRNPRSEIRRFLETYHQSHYFVYNFCIEKGRTYDPKIFSNRVRRFPFEDHCCPPLQMMVDFANTAKAWLEEDQDNICCLHCKAGKGRSGLMACVLLIRFGECSSAQEAINKYDETRTVNKKGLTVTSQRKYVHFYEKIWRSHWGVAGNIGDIPAQQLQIPYQPQIYIDTLELRHLNLDLDLRLRAGIYNCSEAGPLLVHECEWSTPKAGAVIWSCRYSVRMDFMIRVEAVRAAGGSKTLFEFWHNTLFVNREKLFVEYDWSEMNYKRKSGVHEQLGPDMKLRFNFTETVYRSLIRVKPPPPTGPLARAKSGMPLSRPGSMKIAVGDNIIPKTRSQSTNIRKQDMQLMLSDTNNIFGAAIGADADQEKESEKGKESSVRMRMFNAPKQLSKLMVMSSVDESMDSPTYKKLSRSKSEKLYTASSKHQLLQQQQQTVFNPLDNSVLFNTPLEQLFAQTRPDLVTTAPSKEWRRNSDVSSVHGSEIAMDLEVDHKDSSSMAAYSRLTTRLSSIPDGDMNRFDDFDSRHISSPSVSDNRKDFWTLTSSGLEDTK